MKLITRADAFRLGSKRYFDGKPCPSGHVSEKLVSNYTCIQCLHEKYFAKRKVKRDADKVARDAIDAEESARLRGNHPLPGSKKEAKTLGLTRYFTGRPCPHGHISERLNNGRCVTCHQLAGVAYKETEAGRARIANSAKRRYQLDVSLSRQKERTKRETNIQHKLRCAIRVRIKHALRGNYKESSALVYLGCSIQEARAHLEGQFLPGMSWDNYGKYGWHIDHIFPISSFDMTDENQRKEAFRFTNLQPLWAEDNQRKSYKMPDSLTSNMAMSRARDRARSTSK